ncbi:similar to Saccharomyces cerevisiae YGR202C PCT1 Cholinephosphate cytidylyltransferase [Maudiozyma barnettii]|uniref:choline-phosphate cytidylyltransferase n=1 Tax=Maudiozyma barnettii TaxID=61262 RepID=A0A8H2ZHL9_9SACH|nr:choline-phosphate cytidylyltransferase [Kazachstania barnettii]CAB4254903.1 similar to Saccharomyces cerevisiae YGR202C PCT1 Cholinephosphate cytidylyltransferase [Kazachstania barnettii]CAD1783167.1 similar to Saccharomyces cerevisiae YGR202C PCT1 Cholinephosphate cytidylyltransferase [Kazachstania barnettii]
MSNKVSRTDSLKKTLSRSKSSLTNLFKKNKRKHARDDDDEEEDENGFNRNNKSLIHKDDNEDNENDDDDNARSHKRRHVEDAAKEKLRLIAFQKNEKLLDAKLPKELRKYRPQGYSLNLPPKDRPIRIYADGVFDLFHLGHMKQLEQCKKSFPNVTLICGVPSDKVTHNLKGLTVLSDKQRCETLTHCRWVDEVISNAPWCVTPAFLKEHEIDYVAHDDLPYVSADSDDIYKPIKEMGKFLTTQRTNGISTSDIITKIIRDYDKYLLRNFARGATRQELNVSWLKKNELEFKKHIKDFREYFKKNQESLNVNSKDLYFEVREILLRKTLGNKLYKKLLGNNKFNPKDIHNREIKKLHDRLSDLSDSSSQKDNDDDDEEEGSSEIDAEERDAIIRSKSPPSEFADQYTGEKRVKSKEANPQYQEDDDEDEKTYKFIEHAHQDIEDE